MGTKRDQSKKDDKVMRNKKGQKNSKIIRRKQDKKDVKGRKNNKRIERKQNKAGVKGRRNNKKKVIILFQGIQHRFYKCADKIRQFYNRHIFNVAYTY